MEILGTFGYIAVAILILFFMIAVHEFGHYIAGKILGFKITEFALGMGKVLFKRTSKRTGEVFTIRAIPLGGFCSFYGDDGLESKTVGYDRNKDGSEDVNKNAAAIPFDKQAPWKRLIVLFAGGFFNFICAILFSIVLLMLVGYNQFVGIDTVKTSSPSGLESGDIVHSISIDGGEEFHSFTLLSSFSSYLAKCDADSEIVLKYERDGKMYQTDAFNLSPTGEDKKLEIGITTYSIKAPIGFLELIWKSIVFCAEIAWLILSFLWGLITGKVSLSGVGGPVATVSVMTQSVSNSLLNIFILVPMISVNLGLFNLLPLPALDGSRMVFTSIEWVRGKPVNQRIEGRIHMIGLLVLFGLVFLADINYLLGGLKFILYNRLLL